MPVYSLVMARTDRRLGVRLRPFEGECGDSSKLGPPPEIATFGMPTSDPNKGPQWCMAFTGMGRVSAQGTMLSGPDDDPGQVSLRAIVASSTERVSLVGSISTSNGRRW